MNEEKKETVGFPWLLVIQIVLAVISYLIQKSNSHGERAYLYNLKSQLQAGFPEVKDAE